MTTLYRIRRFLTDEQGSTQSVVLRSFDTFDAAVKDLAVAPVSDPNDSLGWGAHELETVIEGEEA